MAERRLHGLQVSDPVQELGHSRLLLQGQLAQIEQDLDSTPPQLHVATDLVTGDLLLVQGRACKLDSQALTLEARKVVVLSASDEDEGDESTTTTTSTTTTQTAP